MIEKTCRKMSGIPSTVASSTRTFGVGLRSAAVATVLGAVALTGCGSDESAQEKYCDAGESVRSSLASLTDLDLIAEGTDGLNSAVGDVRSDLNELSDAATDAAADEVDTLEDAVEGLEQAISDLSGGVSTDDAAALGTAIQGIGTAAEAVFGTLTDC
jgi:hypothetical protein